MRHVPSSLGVEVAVHDFGGSGPSLLLTHATGFHAHVLAPMARHLAGRFHCWGIDSRGQGDSVSPEGLDFAWDGFGDDVLSVVDELELEGAVAFGHSAGGAALLTAEAARPGTFRAMYCFEPIVWSPPAPLERRHALVEGALRRRDAFPSMEDAYANFSSKPPFSMFDPAVVRAYVDHGFEDAGDGSVRLKCRREVEAQIYRQGLVYDGFNRLGAVHCPVVVARGENSDAISPELAAEQANALPGGNLEVVPGVGHFGPLEKPAEVAERVVQALAGST